MCVYVYICHAHISEVGGVSSPLGLPRNREIDFGFVSCSCRACVRAGEAKLRGRPRADVIPTLVALLARCAPTAAAAPSPALFWPRPFLMVYARVLKKILAFDGIRKGFTVNLEI